MITAGIIRNGSNYLQHHLRRNDYRAEGEKSVLGEWIGEGARALGPAGTVTGVLVEMERFAAVRERRGEAKHSESFRLTGNFTGALFLHDASRDLDPQLHAHAVLANATWDVGRTGWFALQPAEMLRASPYLRQVLYRELAGRLRALGYEPYELNSKGFSVRGVEHLSERFSKRSRAVEKLAVDFAAEKGRKPTKREVEILVRESRDDKLTEVSTPKVRARQRAELSRVEADDFDALVRAARVAPLREQWSHGLARTVLEAALRHVYERSSVAREGVVLGAALELHPDFFHWRELRAALETHPEVIRRDGELTLRMIRGEEAATVERVSSGRNTRFVLGDPANLPPSLTAGQRIAASEILGSRDFVSVLVGDAGTGKTTVLTAIEGAHVVAGGKRFMPLAPTTKARDALVESGFDAADTVQRFLVSEAMQREAVGRVLLVDETGLLSTQQLDQLTKVAQEVRARVLLVGDTKQHYSVERGDALRNVIDHANAPVVRLAEVLRQRNESDRQFSRLLASGDAAEAFAYADRRGIIREAGSDDVLFAKAAEHFVENKVKGIGTLVVIPFWDEIERFNAQVRPALRKAGLLGEVEVVREAVKPFTWTAEQKTHWEQYQVGDRLVFARNTRFFKRGASAEVVAVLRDGVIARGLNGREAKLTRKQRAAFDVGRVQTLSVATGDRLLIRGRNDDAGFANGDFKEVAHVDPVANRVIFTDGRELPPGFAAWTYGHAITSYRSQGSTSEESLLVLGEVAARAFARRQFYVGNTRFRGAHAIYVAQKDEILARLHRTDDRRELATEFMQRHRIWERLHHVSRTLQKLRPNVLRTWMLAAAHRMRARQQEHRNLRA